MRYIEKELPRNSLFSLNLLNPVFPATPNAVRAGTSTSLFLSSLLLQIPFCRAPSPPGRLTSLLDTKTWLPWMQAALSSPVLKIAVVLGGGVDLCHAGGHIHLEAPCATEAPCHDVSCAMSFFRVVRKNSNIFASTFSSKQPGLPSLELHLMSNQAPHRHAKVEFKKILNPV